MTNSQIKEYINLAIAAGKSDASNMANHILKKIEGNISMSVENAMVSYKEETSKHLKDHLEILNGIQNELKKLHLEADPIIDAKKAFILGGKIVLWVTSIVIAIGGATITVKQLLNSYFISHNLH